MFIFILLYILLCTFLYFKDIDYHIYNIVKDNYFNERTSKFYLIFIMFISYLLSFIINPCVWIYELFVIINKINKRIFKKFNITNKGIFKRIDFHIKNVNNERKIEMEKYNNLINSRLKKQIEYLQQSSSDYKKKKQKDNL